MSELTPFDEFIGSLESMGAEINPDALSVQEQRAVGSVFDTVAKFLVSHNMVPADDMSSIESLDEPVRRLNQAATLEVIGAETILDLATQCQIPANHLVEAAESISLCIHNYAKGYDLATHFSTASPASSHGDYEARKLDSVIPSQVISSMFMDPESAATEAFGSFTQQTISDAKVAITVTILRYHRSALQRLIPNVPHDSNIVMFTVDHLEMYDLTKSRDASSAVRNQDKHRTPMIDLYRDPSPANTTLKPIHLNTANDAAAPDNVLMADDLLLINKEANAFDLSIDAGTIGYENIDYTDLVGDNVRIKNLFVTVTDGTNTELLKIGTVDRAGSRLVMTADNKDSSDRSCSLRDYAAFDNATLQSDTAATVLLAGLTADGVIQFNFNAAGQINLKTSDCSILGTGSAVMTTKSGNAVAAADATLFGSLVFTLVAGEFAMNFSEENIRKTTKSMRILTKTLGYEIPGSSNVMVQYSLTQTRPEVVVDGLTKLLSIGVDDRGINTIIDVIASVNDQLQAEKALAASNNYVNGVGQSYVCGQRVRPAVYMGSIDIAPSVANMRSGEMWGDVRGFVDKNLMEILVRLFNESYYLQELPAGEKPVFTVLCSGWVMSSILSIPHYHKHLGDQAGEGRQDSANPIEYLRILPNGVQLRVVTTTFDYMTNQMLIIPVRPSQPRDTMNFARNAERGVYTASAAISQQSAVYRQLIANQRSIVLPLNPVAAFIQISGITNIFNGVSTLGT